MTAQTSDKIKNKKESKMDQKKLDRINELARKQKVEGLTEEEKEEQKLLRRAYIDSVKNNIKAQMGNPEEYKKDKGN